MKKGGVLIVDATIEELKPGTELESMIRRIDSEGKSGLILYGPTYRPAFRAKARAKEAESPPIPAGRSGSRLVENKHSASAIVVDRTAAVLASQLGA